jgi:hypothetical protein
MKTKTLEHYAKEFQHFLDVMMDCLLFSPTLFGMQKKKIA